MRIADKAVEMPHTYECARIVFLCAYEADDGSIRTLGMSLLRRNPNDYEVKRCLAGLLVFSDSPEDRDLGAKYVQQVVKDRPTDPRRYALLASQQVKLALVGESIKNAEAGTSYYRLYLDSEPPESPDAKEFNEKIQIVNNLIKKWASQRTIGSNQ